MLLLNTIAAILLIAPPSNGSYDGDEWRQCQIDKTAFEVFTPLMRGVAIDVQVLDSRERLLITFDSFEQDVATLAERITKFQDAPRVEDCERFPDVKERLLFNRQVLDNLESWQATVDPRDWQYFLYESLISDCRKLGNVWATLRDAKFTYAYVCVRRDELLHLRDAIGPEAYYAGQLPPHVPAWRFREIR